MVVRPDQRSRSASLRQGRKLPHRRGRTKVGLTKPISPSESPCKGSRAVPGCEIWLTPPGGQGPNGGTLSPLDVRPDQRSRSASHRQGRKLPHRRGRTQAGLTKPIWPSESPCKGSRAVPGCEIWVTPPSDQGPKGGTLSPWTFDPTKGRGAPVTARAGSFPTDAEGPKRAPPNQFGHRNRLARGPGRFPGAKFG